MVTGKRDGGIKRKLWMMEDRWMKTVRQEMREKASKSEKEYGLLNGMNNFF